MKTRTLLLAATWLACALPLHAAAPVAGGTTAPSGTPCIGSDGVARGDKSIASGSPETHKVNPPGAALTHCHEDHPVPGTGPMHGQPKQPSLGDGQAPTANKPLRDSTGPQAVEPTAVP